MLLADIETAVRQDLFDPPGSTNQRWTTADLDRAIDKAVERYSLYYPNSAYVDMNTQPYQRTYPYPVSWNGAYPVWWIERILYPLQVYGSAVSAPQSGMNAVAISGTGLNIGTYRYAVTFLTQGGETTLSPLLSVTTISGSQKVSLSSIPLGSTAIAANAVIGRNLYRSLVGASTLYFLTTLQDNATTSYSDSAPDTALAGRAQPPVVNTSGIMLWPPAECEFAEYSNLFDSTVSLAAGGNMGTQGTMGTGQGTVGAMVPSFTLKLSDAELPRDASLVMRVFYATKHQLDSTGSTIPEAHRDIVVAGAVAYAMEAYQIPTNDNFAFQDGSVHDHIDDTRIPLAWLSATKVKMAQFEDRLQEIKRSRDFAYGARVRWGDIPVSWPRL